ncbi:AzlC family ABC transporter permease, partial [Bacillus paranthracis]|uniref:AzlC family ABC transporter permease n=1 Tax=Bacillus paranthracis TaxID=2026186 RepID=UPI002848DD1C
STLIYVGSAQFIFAGIDEVGAPVSGIFFSVFFVNLRRLLLSAAFAPYFTKLPLFKNLLIGSQITDETFGVALQHAAQKGYLGERWMIGLNVPAYLN